MKYDFSYKSAEPSSKIKDSNPCTNRPVLCEICSVKNSNSFIWSYNLELHYKLMHSNAELPDEVKRLRDNKERNAVLKKFKKK